MFSGTTSKPRAGPNHHSAGPQAFPLDRVPAFTQAGMPKDIGRKLQDAFFADAELTHRHIVREGLMEAGEIRLPFEFWRARSSRWLRSSKTAHCDATGADTDTLEARFRNRDPGRPGPSFPAICSMHGPASRCDSIPPFGFGIARKAREPTGIFPSEHRAPSSVPIRPRISDMM